MAKKFGDDRTKDRALDTSIDMEEMDDLSLDDPFGGDEGVMGGGGRKPKNATAKMVTEMSKGAAEGAMSVVGEEVERNMPNVAAIHSELRDSYDDLKDLKDEISKQLQPMMTSMENTARKILPRVEKLMPKSWYQKAKATLDERAAARGDGSAAAKSKEQMQNDTIAAEIGQLFQQQQLDNQKHLEFEANKKTLMDRAIGSIQFKKNQHALTRIYDSLRSTEIFHRTLHTAYMKKSLELKYKHLFVAQDTHNLLAKSVDAFEKYLKAIVDNTALPDVMKTQSSDYIKKQRTEKYGTMMSTYLSNARQAIFKKIKNTVKDTLSNLSFAAEAGEGLADNLEMMQEMGEMTGEDPIASMAQRFGGSLIGRALAGGPVGAAFRKFAPWANAVNGRLENFKPRMAMGLDKLRSKWSAGSWWQQMIADYLPSLSGTTTSSNDLLTRSEEAAAFDKLTRQTIVEIIPGYLGKILHSVDRISDPNAQERTYNIYKRRFTTTKELHDDVLDDPRMFGSKWAQSGAVGKAIATLRTGFKRNNPEGDEKKVGAGIEFAISRVIANHATIPLHFDAEKLQKFVEDPESMKDDMYIKGASTGISPKTFRRVAETIVNNLKDSTGKLDKTLVRRFDDAVISSMPTTDGFKQQAASLRENFGMSDALQDLFLDDNKINRELVAERVARTTKKGVKSYISYESRLLDEYLKDKDYTDSRINEMRDDFKKTGFYGFAKDLWDKIHSGKKGEDGLTDEEREAFADEGPADTTEGAPKKKAKKKKAKASKPKAKTFKDSVTQLLKAKDKKSAAKALEDLKTSTKASITDSVKGAGTGIWSKTKKVLTDIHNGLPQSKEDVDKAVSDVISSVEKFKDAVPKDRAQATAFARDIADKLRKKYPDQAAKIRDAVKTVNSYAEKVKSSREGKFVSAVAGYTVDVATDLYNEYGKPVKDEAMKKLMPYIDQAIEDGSKMKADIINKIKASPEAWKQFKKDFPKKYKLFKEEAPGNILSGINAIKKSLGTAAEKTGSAYASSKKFFSGLGASFRKGAGVEEAPETAPVGDSIRESRTSEPGENAKFHDELLTLMREWKDAMTLEHNTIFEMVGLIEDHLERGITVGAAGTVGGAPAGGPIKRRKYGLFGKAGYGLRKSISWAGKKAWQVGGWTARQYGKVISGGIDLAKDAAGGILGGVKTLGGWLTNTAGLNPFVDLFAKGQEGKKPLITWRKQAFDPGIVYGVKEKGVWKAGTERVKATKDIAKKGIPCFDPRTGNCVVTEDDIKNGLFTYQGPLASISHMATAGIRGFFGAEKAFWGGAFKVGGIIAGGLFGVGGGKAEKYVDIYLKDRIKDGPLVTRRQQVKGTVAFGNGEKIERSSDIHEPVYDISVNPPACLITKEQIKEGLVDVNNKPLGSAPSVREGLIGKAFGLGQTIAKGIFGKTGLKIAGTAVSAISAVYKGLWDAILGGGKAVGRGAASLGARLFGFDTPNGFGKKAFTDLNTRLDKLIEITTAINNRLGGGYGGGEGGPGDDETGSGRRGKSSKKKPIKRGRKGFWRDGKFVPDPKGDSYEGYGLAGAGLGAKGKAAAERAMRENARSGVTEKGADHYVETDHTLPEEMSGDGSGGGMSLRDLTDWLIRGELARRYIPRRWRAKLKLFKMKGGITGALKRGAQSVGRGGMRVLKSVGGDIGHVTRAGWEAGKRGGVKAGVNAFRKSASRLASTRAGQVSTKAAELARKARLAKLKLKATPGKLKVVTDSLKSSGKLAKLGSIAKSGASILDIIAAGSAANEAYQNADSILGKYKRDVTSAERDIVSSSAAMDSMSSGALLGLDHLLLGDNINNKLGQWIYGDKNAGAKARVDIDKQLGIDKFNIGTNLRSRLGDHGGWDYINPLVGIANLIDGTTNVANDLTKGTLRIAGGLGHAAGTAIYAAHGNRVADIKLKKAFAQKAKNDEITSAVWTSLDPSAATLNNREKQVIINMWTASDPASKLKMRSISGHWMSDSELVGKFKAWYNDNKDKTFTIEKNRVVKLSKPRGVESTSTATGSKNAPGYKKIFQNTGMDAVAAVGGKSTPEKFIAPSGVKTAVQKFEEFKKIYARKDRATVDRGILETYGIDYPNDPEEWDKVYKDLEAKATAEQAVNDTTKKKEVSKTAGESTKQVTAASGEIPSFWKRAGSALSKAGKFALAGGKRFVKGLAAGGKTIWEGMKRSGSQFKEGLGKIGKSAWNWLSNTKAGKWVGDKVDDTMANYEGLRDIIKGGENAAGEGIKSGFWRKLTNSEEATDEMTKIMQMPREEAIKACGGEENYFKLLANYRRMRMNKHLGWWDRITGKSLESDRLMSGEDKVAMNYEAVYQDKSKGSGTTKMENDISSKAITNLASKIINARGKAKADKDRSFMLQEVTRSMHEDWMGAKHKENLRSNINGDDDELFDNIAFDDNHAHLGAERRMDAYDRMMNRNRKKSWFEKSMDWMGHTLTGTKRSPSMKTFDSNEVHKFEMDTIMKAVELGRSGDASARKAFLRKLGEDLAERCADGRIDPSIAKDVVKELQASVLAILDNPEDPGEIPYRSEYDEAKEKLRTSTWTTDATELMPKSVVDVTKMTNLKDVTSQIDFSRIRRSSKPTDLLNPSELNAKLDNIQQNRFDRVTAAIKEPQKAQTEQIEQQRSIIEKLDEVAKNYKQFSENFSKVIDKDGLKVTGMDTLTAVTAAGAKKSAPAAPTVINNTIIKTLDDGLDLRKKQL